MIGASSNAEQVIARLQARIDRLSNLTQPLQKAGQIVRDAAVMRIKRQGGDQTWAPTLRGGHIGYDTGRMMNSIQISAPSASQVTIGTNLPYARWFQEGTGIYAGHKAWTVTSNALTASQVSFGGRNRMGALKFEIGGKLYFRRSVTIKGEPKRPYLLVGPKERADIIAEFTAFFNDAVKR